MLSSVLFMLSCVVAAFSTSGMFHVSHALWYLFRLFTVHKTCDLEPGSFDNFDLKNPTYISDVLVFVVISISQIPFGCGGVVAPLGSFVWIPWIVHVVMGYPTSIWYVVITSAFFCMAVSECPQLLFVCVHLLWGVYRGSYKKWSLGAAAVVHLCFALGSAIQWDLWEFDLISVASGLLAAEAKYLMMYEPYKAVEALSYLSIVGVWVPLESGGWIWTLVPYLSNFTLFGWSQRWRYTDKVWYNADICIFISALLVAFCVSLL
tara:strand:+ start:181 stop:969 length:789 start_codon:yes stop_codon:yes gene_type:complete